MSLPNAPLQVAPMVPQQLGAEFIRLHALFWCVVYLALYYPLRQLLPDNTLRDADLIAELMQSGTGSQSLSFIYTAALLDLVPEPLQDVVVNIIGVLTILIVTLNFRKVSSLLLAPLLVLPMLVVNVMSPTKETIVLVMGILIFFMAHRLKSEWKLLALIGLIYCVYGSYIRIYFVLIFVLLLFFKCWQHTPLQFRPLYVVGAIIMVLVLPPEFYQALQGSRDNVAIYFSTTSANLVRTFFGNPLPPDSFWNFIYNYGYAFITLNIPLTFFQTPKEFLLQFNTIIWWGLVLVGLCNLRGNLLTLTQLFLAHLLVLQLFEPDLGSYLRHASSVFIYLVPAMLWFENWRSRTPVTAR